MNMATMKHPRLEKPVLVDYVFVCHHLAAEQRRQWEALEGREYEPDMAAVELAGGLGPRWVLVEPGSCEALAIGGFRSLTPTVWQDWLMTTERAWTAYPVALTRACRRMVELMLTEATRVQAVCLADRANVQAWYRTIGYEYEGTLRSYGAGGEDVVIYGRVRT